MEWLTPISGIVAAALVVPALVALYFLKLKRREVTVSSTLLWKRAIQDLQVNAPFQRLRRNILLLLQLLCLAALLAALARPVLMTSPGDGRRYVILIDRSASMSATDVKPTRLEEAKRQARVLIDGLRSKQTWYLAQQGDQAMIIAFDASAKVLCNFSTDKKKLLAALDAITPTDGQTRLAEAVTIGRAFATPIEEANNRSVQQAARLELFSDGRIADLDQVAVSKDELVFHAIGQSGDNAAIVAMQARRSYEEPERLDVFANVANFGPAPVKADVQLMVDGKVRSVRPIEIPALTAAKVSPIPGVQGEPDKPGRTSVAFELKHPTGGAIEVRLLREDALVTDNAAWAILQPPRRLSVLLVTTGNNPLRAALKACPLAKLDIETPEEFAARDREAMSVDRPYGLIVLDRVAPSALPAGNYLVFGQPPTESGATSQGELKNQAIIDWQFKHPVLNFVNLGNFFASKAQKLALPREAVVLAEFEDGPALALVRRPRGSFLLAGFNLLDTNWPFDPGLVMFCFNAMSFLGGEAAEDQRLSLKVGQALLAQAAGREAKGTVSGPGVVDGRLVSDAAGRFRYAATGRAGVYRLAAPGRPDELFAVNLLDENESAVAAAKEITCVGQTVAAQTGAPRPANREIWPLLALLGLLLVCLEWYVYNSKIRL